MTVLAAHTRPVTRVAAAIVALTTLAALLAATNPGAAAGLFTDPPHPVLSGTADEVLDVLATNLPALAVPPLLALTLAGHSRAWRSLGDLITAAIMIANTGLVGAALGVYGTRLLPYLPHLPLELAALACSCSAWWATRTQRHPIGRLVLWGLVLAVAAAAVEVYATPHTSR